jgi:hypothetical protein
MQVLDPFRIGENQIIDDLDDRLPEGLNLGRRAACLNQGLGLEEELFGGVLVPNRGLGPRTRGVEQEGDQ